MHPKTGYLTSTKTEDNIAVRVKDKSRLRMRGETRKGRRGEEEIEVDLETKMRTKKTRSKFITSDSSNIG